MHPKLKSGSVAIYARYSSERQRETSIEDQVRRCREFVANSNGDPEKATVFSDYAMSGASLDRPGFEAMMSAVDAGRVDAIVTEDLSRISRDFADSAGIFKRLQFADVPLLGVADGIDTSSKNAKLSFTVKSLVADLYLDDLRDKTMRGLEGRALAGFATGNTPFGFRTEPVSKSGTVTGHKIEIFEEQAAIIRWIFGAYLDGESLTSIAKALNRDGILSPRAKTRHKTSGWGQSTIRAILYNEKYAGLWKYKQREWVKIPGTNKRTPRNRPASEVMCFDRPELRIIDDQLWRDVQSRLLATKRKYTRKSTQGVPSRRRSRYLLSGILVCDECGAPLTIQGSTPTYYRCSTNRTKGLCPNSNTVRETEIRSALLREFRKQLTQPDEVEYVRQQVAQELRDYSKKIKKQLKEHQGRLGRTEDRIRGLVGFIADGDSSEYVVETLRDLEAQARTEKASIASLRQSAEEPLRLPSIEEITSSVFDLDERLTADIDEGRSQLRRWLEGEQVRVRLTPKGTPWEASGALLPLVIVEEERRRHVGPNSEIGTNMRNLCSGDKI